MTQYSTDDAALHKTSVQQPSIELALGQCICTVASPRARNLSFLCRSCHLAVNDSDVWLHWRRWRAADTSTIPWRFLRDDNSHCGHRRAYMISCSWIPRPPESFQFPDMFRRIRSWFGNDFLLLREPSRNQWRSAFRDGGGGAVDTSWDTINYSSVL